MSRFRNEQFRATLSLQRFADNHQTGIFARGTRSRLKRGSFKAGNHSQFPFQIFEELYISLHLIFWGKRMNSRHARERNRNHSSSRIELHRTRSKRNHRMGKRDILSLEALEITHHLGLGMVFLEDILLHVIHVSYDSFVERPETIKLALGLYHRSHAVNHFHEEANQRIDILYRSRFIDAQAYPTFF